MKTFSEMRIENYVTSLKRFFEDPNTEVLKLDIDMDPDIKDKSIVSFFKLVYKEQKKSSITLTLTRDERPTTEKKKSKRKLKKVNNYNKKGECEITPSIEYPRQ